MKKLNKIKIAIIVGETSGDHLGAALMHALKNTNLDITFVGIGGDKMKALGFHSFFEMERLAIMGFIEPLCRLPELLRMRRFIINELSQNPPDIYIGIDAPDFNLGIARILKSRGIKTLHYVSPTIWAWRPNRIKKIVQALNDILLIFPFEPDIYKRYNQQNKTQLGYHYIGHPLADEIALSLERQPARVKLQLDLQQKIIAILPGSRVSEIQAITVDFIKTVEILYKNNQKILFVAAMVNEQKAKLFKSLLDKMDCVVPIIICVNQTRTVLQACNAAMVVSGTATLETALMKRPFIVGYKTSFWQYQLAKFLIKVNYIAMPNIIANKLLVTEYIQYNLDPIKMAFELSRFLQEDMESVSKVQMMMQEFENMHHLLKQNASQKAAQVVVNLLERD